MTDIVERLRSPATVFYNYEADNGRLFKEAADEITRLRVQRRMAVRALREIIKEYPLASGTMRPLISGWPKDGHGSIGRARATLDEIEEK